MVCRAARSALLALGAAALHYSLRPPPAPPPSPPTPLRTSHHAARHPRPRTRGTHTNATRTRPAPWGRGCVVRGRARPAQAQARANANAQARCRGACPPLQTGRAPASLQGRRTPATLLSWHAGRGNRRRPPSAYSPPQHHVSSLRCRAVGIFQRHGCGALPVHKLWITGA